jgi:Flp pilus assembly CpaF family ATPase
MSLDAPGRVDEVRALSRRHPQVLPEITGRGLEGLRQWMAVAELADLYVWPGATRVRLMGRRWLEVTPLVDDALACKELISHLLHEAGHLADPVNGCHEVEVDGARVTAFLDWGRLPALFIRSHRSRPERLDDLVALGMLPAELADDLARAVRAGVAILVSGAMSVGKTTMAAALCREIPEDELVVTVEDTYELGLDDERPTSVLPFLARAANVEGAGERSMALLSRGALRAAADRIVVGEVRGKEALHLVRAMEVGASGSIGTIHADSAPAALDKLCDYILEGSATRTVAYVARMVARHIEIVIHLEVLRGHHLVAEVYEVTGVAEDGTLQGGALWEADADLVCRPTGVRPSPRLAHKAGWR